MDTTWKTSIQQQFGAAIDMLDNALIACPDELWLGQLWHEPADQPGFSQFWYITYHTLIWLDLYLSGAEEGFVPPAPFTLHQYEWDADGSLPDRPYTKQELQSYLEYGRQKCRATIEALTDAQARRPCTFGWGDVSFAELLLYNMRHVQEHAAQLSLFLGQNQRSPSGWVAKVKEK